MISKLRTKAKVFQIAYKTYYHEISDWSSEYIKAIKEEDALRIFASRHNIKPRNNKSPQNWKWWDGEWYMSFRFIREIKQEPRKCPCCKGLGIILTEEG